VTALGGRPRDAEADGGAPPSPVATGAKVAALANTGVSALPGVGDLLQAVPFQREAVSDMVRKFNVFSDVLEGQPDRDFEDDESAAVPEDKGSVLGAVALITGSTVGAGILALPTAVAPAGFAPSMAAMGSVWLLLTLEALLLAESNITLMRERDEYRLIHGRPHSDVTLSLTEMAGRSLGRAGEAATTLVYLSLSMTLLVAYICKSGEILAAPLGMDAAEAGALFTVVMGSTLCFGGLKTADVLNRGLTAVLVFLFFAILGGGSGVAEWDRLSFADWGVAPQTVPILFLALVYHDLVPVVCSYLGGDVRRIRDSILIGSAVPFVLFGAWCAVALAVLPPGVAADPLELLSGNGENAGAALVISAFSLAAIATSFIGSCVGLSEFLNPFLQRAADAAAARVLAGATAAAAAAASTSPAPEEKGPAWALWRRSERAAVRTTSYALLLLPPLGVAVTCPDVFFAASSFAGAYGMTALYGVLPPVAAGSLRAEADAALRMLRPDEAEAVRRRGGVADAVQLVPGGRLVLLGCGLSAASVFAYRLVQDLAPHLLLQAATNAPPAATAAQIADAAATLAS